MTAAAASARRRAGRFARRLAIVFFLAWVAILLAGADFPPPPGFAGLVLLVAIACAVLVHRVPQYLQWHAMQRPRRLTRVLLEGIAAGLAVGAALVLLNPIAPVNHPRPGVGLSLRDTVIWFSVLGAVGLVNALLVYASTAAYRRRAVAGN